MGKEKLTFGNIEIDENKFYGNKNQTIKIKVLVSNKISFDEKNLSIYIKLSH